MANSLGSKELVDASIANGVFSPEVWVKEVQEARESKLVCVGATNQSYTKNADVGHVIHVPTISHLSARDKVENADVIFETAPETTKDITLNKWKYSGVGIEKIVKEQSIVDVAARYQKRIGYALAQVLDSDVADQFQSFTNTQGTLGSNLTDAHIRRGVQYLDDADAPEDERFIIISPAEKNSFLGIDKFVSRDYVGADTPTLSGEVGRLYDMPVLRTTNLNKPAATQADCAMLHREAIAVVVQMSPTMETQRDIRSQSDLIVSSQIYGLSIMRNDHGVWLKAMS